MQLKTLDANLGNNNPFNYFNKFKLTNPFTEKRIEARIKSELPDIISLQELNPKFFESQVDLISHQATRLLGDHYNIWIDKKTSFLSIAIHKSVMGIPHNGQITILDNIHSPQIENCDPGFNWMMIDILIFNYLPVTIVNVHLNSRNSTCRVKMLKQIWHCLEENNASNILIMGDFNFDPWRNSRSPETNFLIEFMKKWGLNFHHELDKNGLPSPTLRSYGKFYTVDLLMSNFLYGDCLVLGISKGTTRLDGGCGTDHYSLLANLFLEEDKVG
jgi:endonuclease/exonuclease/phosphatase family metal-dependent hydrolase